MVQRISEWFKGSMNGSKVVMGVTSLVWEIRISWKSLEKVFLGHFVMPPKNSQKSLKKVSAAPRNFEKVQKKS